MGGAIVVLLYREACDMKPDIQLNTQSPNTAVLETLSMDS
jgi:hypothetical protein